MANANLHGSVRNVRAPHCGTFECKHSSVQLPSFPSVRSLPQSYPRLSPLVNKKNRLRGRLGWIGLTFFLALHPADQDRTDHGRPMYGEARLGMQSCGLGVDLGNEVLIDPKGDLVSWPGFGFHTFLLQ